MCSICMSPDEVIRRKKEIKQGKNIYGELEILDRINHRVTQMNLLSKYLKEVRMLTLNFWKRYSK